MVYCLCMDSHACRFRPSSLISISLCASALLSHAALAVDAAIHQLPGGTPIYPTTTVFGISPNGERVLGMSIGLHTTAATAWDAQGGVQSVICCRLGAAYTHSSDDASIIVGWMKGPVPGSEVVVLRPFRLEMASQIYDGYDDFGDPNEDVLPRGVDATGRFMAFWSEPGTQPQSSVILDGIFGSVTHTWAPGAFAPVAMNAAGNLVAGTINADLPPSEGGCWTPSQTQTACAMFGGCPTSGGLTDLRPAGMSRDGTSIVGTGQLGLSVVPVMMTNNSATALSTCPGTALDVSADGGVVIGSFTCSGSQNEAFIWTPQAGTRAITQALIDSNVDVTGWTLTSAVAISDSGEVIAGDGFYNGEQRGWVVTLPRGLQCDAIDFNNDSSLFDPQDIDAFLSVYSEGPCVPASATCNDIDFNNDGSVFDPCDIDAFLLSFSEGPCTPCGV